MANINPTLKSVRRCAVLLLALVAAVATYGYDEPVYTVTVTEGTNSLDEATVEVTQNGETTSAAFSTLTLDQGGTFVKKGTGFLQSSTAMSVFTGEVVVAEGALILTEDGQAGAILANQQYRTDWTGSASLVVSNGATIVLVTTSENTWPHLVQPVTLSGEGLNGLGAIHHVSLSKKDDGTQLYYSHITLLDDTKIVYEDDGRVGFGYSVFNMNGHDLKCVTLGSTRANQVFCGMQTKNPGNILADHTQLYFSNSKTWEGDSANTVTLTNNPYFRMYNFGGQIKWKLVNAHEGLVGYSSNASPSYDRADHNIWHGPWRLDKNMYLGANSTSTDNHGVVVVGSVSGEGGITLRHHWLRLKSKSNTFSGGMTINTSGHLVLYGNGSIPANGGTLKIQNGGEVIFDETNTDALSLTTMAYPAIDWNVASGSTATLPGTTNTIVKSLVKRGTGTLNLVGDLTGTEDLTGSVAVTGVTEIAAGTIRLPCARSGFVSGWFNSSDSGDSSNSKALANLDYMTTNKIVRRTELAYTSDKDAWRKTSGSVYSGVIAYEGYIWNRAEENKRLVFAQAMWKGSYLYVDGTRIKGYGKPLATSGSEVSFSHSSGDNKRVAFYTVTLSPGPHKIDLRAYTTSEWGPWGNPAVDTVSRELTNAVWKANFGWAVNWNGTDSTNCVDFSEIADPGDGSVFTVTTNGVDETIAALRTSFEHLKFTGGTLDIYGSDLHVPVLECGGGSITNSNEYQMDCTITVTDKLLVDSASYSGGTLTVHGRLRFAEGAALDCGDISKLMRGDHAFIRATGGIEGMPAFDSEASGNRGWVLGKETIDGIETLTLTRHTGFTVIVK